ncbi:MAG: DoxX family protein [Ilumatobacteraceae bacterium]
MVDASRTGLARGAYHDFVLLLLRGILGLIFFAQGMTKLGWFGGTDPPGMGGLEQFLKVLGYEQTTALSWLLTGTEIVAGVLLVVGLLTPLAAAGVIGISLNGVFALSWAGGFIAYNGWIAYAVMAFAVAYFGPGRYSLHSNLSIRSRIGIPHLHDGSKAASFALVLGVAAGLVVLIVFGPGFPN